MTNYFYLPHQIKKTILQSQQLTTDEVLCAA